MFSWDATEPRGGIRYASAIEAGQIDLLYRQAPSSLFATVINALLLTAGLWTRVAPSALTLWALTLVALSLGRYRLLRSYRAASRPVADLTPWKFRFLVGVALNGLLWGCAGVWFFVADSYAHQMLLAFVLAGMAAGAVTTLSPLRGASLVFLFPALIPYTLRIFADGDPVHAIMGVMVVLFVTMMWLISIRMYTSVSESLGLQFENLDLVEDLRRASARRDAAHRRLAAEVDAKQRAQLALQESHAELERRVVERTRELAQSRDHLAVEKELFRITLASIGDGVITTDRDGRVTYLNPPAEEFTGWPSEEAKGMSLARVFHAVSGGTPGMENPAEDAAGTGRASGHLVLTDRHGRKRDIHRTSAPICDRRGRPVGTVLTFRDISEERKLAHRLSHQATHDALTGLVNRREFERRLDRVLHSRDRDDSHALIFMDLDQFKVVNDTCGHVAGDELLRQISALMQTRIRTRDTFARLGGDEFAVLLEHCPRDEAIGIAHTLRELAQGFRFGWQDKSFVIGVSIGLVDISGSWENSASALRAADTACYMAKDRGRNRVCVYEPDDQAVTRRFGEMQWMPRIQQALAEGRMRLYWQRIVPTSPAAERGEFGEILIRLLDEQGQVVLPGAFLPAAERYGQMNAIDRWVIAEAFAALQARSASQHGTVVAVNLSGQSLSDEDFLGYVVDRMRSSRIAPSSLCFEITETAAISDFSKALTFIMHLKELGCRFSLDDFGSGLSSFGYLKNLPVDYLKIDGRFVKEIVNSRVDETMVEAIQRLGHVMGLQTIAEWVEDAQTLDKLTSMKVDYVQGFHMAPPRPM